MAICLYTMNRESQIWWHKFRWAARDPGADKLGCVRECAADSQHIGYKFRRTWHNLSHNLNKYHAIMRDICDKITKYQENNRTCRVQPKTALENKQNAAAWPNVWSFCLAIYFIGYCILNQKRTKMESAMDHAQRPLLRATRHLFVFNGNHFCI